MELTKIQLWLSAFPGLKGFEWVFDRMPHKLGMAALIPQGVTEIDRIEDLLGNRKQTLAFTCQVCFSGTGKAQMLWDLQHWVDSQDAPQLGQGRKSASLRDGKHLKENKLGLDLYTAQLKVTYERYYEVNEYGED